MLLSIILEIDFLSYALMKFLSIRYMEKQIKMKALKFKIVHLAEAEK